MVGFAASAGDAQTPWELTSAIVFAPNANRTVTLSREGVLVSTLDVPAGTWLRISHDDRNPANALPEHLLDQIRGGRAQQSGPVYVLDCTVRVVLHGNVSLRVEVGQNQVARAPKMPVEPSPAVSLTAHNVEVVIAGRD